MLRISSELIYLKIWVMVSTTIEVLWLHSLKLTAKAPENRPSQKEMILFQPSIFRGEHVSFRGRVFPEKVLRSTHQCCLGSFSMWLAVLRSRGLLKVYMCNLIVLWKLYGFLFSNLHPEKLTWNTIMEVWKMIFLFKGVIFRLHVNFPGCSGFITCFLSPYLKEDETLENSHSDAQDKSGNVTMLLFWFHHVHSLTCICSWSNMFQHVSLTNTHLIKYFNMIIKERLLCILNRNLKISRCRGLLNPLRKTTYWWLWFPWLSWYCWWKKSCTTWDV